jgi:hypothetical protein
MSSVVAFALTLRDVAAASCSTMALHGHHWPCCHGGKLSCENRQHLACKASTQRHLTWMCFAVPHYCRRACL